MRRLHRLILAVVAPFTVLGLSGCGASNPVTGQVMYEGRPAQWGYVQLTPDIDKGSHGPTLTLKLSEDGRFSSAQEGKPVVSGEYKVVVSVVPEPGPAPQSIERRFNITISDGGATDLVFEIFRKKKGKGEAVE